MKTILIVEDNPKNMKLVRDLLQHHGHATLEAETGEAGLRLALDRRPDLVLMDIQLPGVDGLVLTRRLRERGAPPTPVIVAFTAFAMKGDRERFLAAGCDGYIGKPIDVATFADEVRALLPAR